MNLSFRGIIYAHDADNHFSKSSTEYHSGDQIANDWEGVPGYPGSLKPAYIYTCDYYFSLSIFLRVWNAGYTNNSLSENPIEDGSASVLTTSELVQYNVKFKYFSRLHHHVLTMCTMYGVFRVLLCCTQQFLYHRALLYPM